MKRSDKLRANAEYRESEEAVRAARFREELLRKDLQLTTVYAELHRMQAAGLPVY